MFVRPNQFRNAKADVQMFYQDGAWNKPIGASQIYMLLIGGGGNSSNTSGGGSGAVTTWYGSAQNVPDTLIIHPSTGDLNNTTVSYKGTSTTVLLQADAGNGLAQGGAAFGGTPFANSGFFQSVAGQNGTGTNTAITASATTFLSGGSGAGTRTSSSGYSVTPNYGYPTIVSSSAGGASPGTDGQIGYFMLQPIIVGAGGSSGSGGTPGGNGGKGAIGCGGGAGGTSSGAIGIGGPGFVLIASW